MQSATKNTLFLHIFSKNVFFRVQSKKSSPKWEVVVGARNWITPPFEFDEFFFPQASWILDTINEKLVPLPGYENVTTCDEAETIRRAKAGV